MVRDPNPFFAECCTQTTEHTTTEIPFFGSVYGCTSPALVTELHLPFKLESSAIQNLQKSGNSECEIAKIRTAMSSHQFSFMNIKNKDENTLVADTRAAPAQSLSVPPGV